MVDSYYCDLTQDLPRIYEAFGEQYRAKEIESSDQKIKRKRQVYPPITYEVRKSVCIVGRHRETVQQIKNQIASLFEDPFPIESFHVKTPSDVLDGAFLVPKIILVAPHCPGRKLIDEVADEGQLDWLYDEILETRADMLLIYTNLPKTIYPAMRHVMYHPKIAQNLFNDQPLLQELATDNCFLTLTENNELNKMQRNLIREWLQNPVTDNHPVFQSADFLTSLELSTRESSDSQKTVSVTVVNEMLGSSFEAYDNNAYRAEELFVPAVEEHPLAEKKKKKKKKKLKFTFKRTPRHKAEDLPQVQEYRDFREEPLELNLFNNTRMTSESANSFF